MRRLLCLVCRVITHVAGDQPLAGCPGCGDRTGVPADADNTVTITLTAHELRILTMWADNYAQTISTRPGMRQMPRVVGGILDGIGQQTAVPLSLTQEMSDLRAAFPESTVRVYRDGRLTDE